MECLDLEAHLSGDDSGDEAQELQCLEDAEKLVELESDSDEEVIPQKRKRQSNPFADELLQDLQNGNDLSYMESRYGKSNSEKWTCPNSECKWEQIVRTAGAFSIDGTVFILHADEEKKCEICGSEDDFVEPPNLLRE